MKIRNWANYKAVVGWKDEKETVPEYNHGRRSTHFTKPSLAVPDMAIPLAVLLSKYRTSGTVSGVLEGVFHGEEEVVPIGFERMDQMEKIDLLRKTAADVNDKRVKLQAIADKQKADSEKAAFDAAVAAAAEAKKVASSPASE